MTNKFRHPKINRAFTEVIKPVRPTWLAVMVCLIILLLVKATTVTFGAGRKSIEPSGQGVESVAVDIDNYGKVTDFFYRGAQPEEKQYAQLAAVGIKTVIDLRDDPKGYARRSSEKNGMRYINMPMKDKAYPEQDAASRFLELVNNNVNWPVFVHCAGGRHRTGVMTAVYRMKIEGWDIDRAYEEMKDYDFYTRWGHKGMKKYVYDYYDQLKRKPQDPSIAIK